MIRRFNRYELKYIVDSRVRDALLPTMLVHMLPDPEGGALGIYDISSLYYDSYDLTCYRAKIDGVNFRRKLRVRRYGELTPGQNPRVMVEIKQRINRTTQKRRLAVPLDEAYAICDGASERTFEDPLDVQVAEEVGFLVGSLQLSPKCVVRYRRRALVGSQYEPGLRITFDENLRVSDARVGLEDGAPTMLFLPPQLSILEVKTNDVMPIWVTRLLAAHEVVISRYSKYCAGMERLRNLRAFDG